MATQAMFREDYAELTNVVRSWDRRLRLRQTVLWLPRSLMPGLVIGLALAVISRSRPWLMPQQIALVSGALVAAGAALFALAVWLWRRSSLASAQRFDVQFHLGERVSTALELSSGTIRSNDELAQRQLADARDRASAVRVSDHIPLALSRRDWVIVVLLAAALALLLVLPNPQTEALTQASAQQTALDNAAEQVRETTQDIAADTSLGNEERQTLLEQLQTTTNTLEQPNITPEEAFAALSDMQTGLENEADDLNRQSSTNQAALQQAADALRQAGQQAGGEAENEQVTGTMEQVTQNLDQITQNVQQMSQAERQQASEALQQAADALESTNPEASQNLSDASQQMQQETLNQEQLEQSLEQAQQQMQQQSQQAQQQQQASQNMSDQAERMQQASQQISQAQQQSQQSQQSQQAQQSQDGEQSQQSQQGQQSQDGQQSQQSQQGQQGNQQGQQSQNGAPQSIQQGSQQSQQGQIQQNSSGDGQEQQQQGNSSQQAQSLAAGDQPGDQQTSDTEGTIQQRAGTQDQTTNNADGQGEGQFEAVNVPRRIGPEPNNGNNVQLDPDASNAPVQEGEFSQNPNGQVTVPYNQVFSDYANAANRALDSDYVPLGLRDVVRDYFTSLEPRR